MITYEEFLKSKIKKEQIIGFKIEDENLNKMLFDFQKYCVKLSLKRGRNALFQDCGSGKTPQQLEWSEQVYRKTKQSVLIVAPLSVAYQTSHKEADKFGYKVNQVKYDSEIKEGINITNYENFSKFNPNRFSGIVLDESSILKSFTGIMRTEIIDFSSNINYRLACTATPSPNDHSELGNHAEFLGIMTYAQMLSEYFTHDSGHTAIWRLKKHAEKKFWEWVSTWSIAVGKPSDIGFDDCGYDLPKLNIIIHEVEHEINYQGDGLFFDESSMDLNDRRKIKKQSIDARVLKAKEIVSENNNEEFLIWCHLNEESEKLKKEIKNSVEVKGSDNNSHKEKSFVDFSDNKIKYLITKPSMAGFGMNFQTTHNQIFVGINDSFEEYYQCIRRQLRFGQIETVNVHLIISKYENTVFQNIFKKIKEHEKLMGNLIMNLNAFRRDRIKSQEIVREEYIKEKYKLINNDSVIELRDKFKENSIDFSCFSIPFLDLYIYSNTENDMGNSLSKKDFYNHFRYLAKELFRVLKQGRNISIHCMMMPVFKYKEGYVGIYDFRGELIRLMRRTGFIYHAEVTIWKDPVVAMTRTNSLSLLYKQIKKDSTMSGAALADYVLTFRKPGENKIPIEHTSENYPLDKWQKIAAPVWMDIKQTNVLSYKGAKEFEDEKHVCPLQLDVIERVLELYSNPNELVLDPFNGIGSSTYQAVKMGRKGIGIELKKSYWEQSIKNMESIVEGIF